MRLSLLTPKQRLALFAVLLLFGSFAVFSDSVAYAASDSTELILVNMYKGFFAPFAQFRKNLAPAGTVLVLSLVVIHICYGGIQLASGTTDLFELALQAVKLSLLGGLIYSAMEPQAWLGVMTGMGSVSLPEVIIHGMQQLAVDAVNSAPKSTMLADLGTAGSGGTDIASSKFFGMVFQAMFEGLRKLIMVPLWPENQPSKAGGIWKLIEAGSEFISLIFAFVFWAATIFFYVLACGMLIMELFGAVLTIAVAIAFTPLMVPWLLFKPLQFLFDSWLKCILIGSLGFVIGILMLAGFGSFVEEAIKALTNVKAGAYESGPKVALVFLPLMLGSFIFGILATKINGLASGLISGSGSDGIGIRAFTGAAKAASAVAGAPGQAGKQIAGGAKVTAGAAASAGRVGMNAVGSVRSGASSAATTASRASAEAGGGAKGAVAGGKALLGSAVSGARAKASAAANSIGSKAKEAAGNFGKGESPGLKAAKAVSADKKLTPSKEQMGSAASAASSAIRSARFAGMSNTEVAKAGQSAASVALTGAPKAGQPRSAVDNSPGVQIPPKGTTPSTPFPSIPKA